MKRRIDWNLCAVVVTGAVLGAYGQGLIDAVWREDFARPAQHWWGVWSLYTCVGVLLGACSCLVVGVERNVLPWLIRRFELARAGPWLRSAFYGLAATLLSYQTAVWTFSGKAISQTAWGALGPACFMLLVLAAVVVLCRWVLRLDGRASPRKRRFGLILVASSGSAGLVLVDQYAFVSLYERLHGYLEWSALLLATLAWAILLGTRRRRIWTRVLWSFTAVCCIFTGATLASSRIRDSIDDSLTHAWIDSVYVGRMLRRAQELETYLKDPLGYDGIHMVRLKRLRNRYGLSDVQLASFWRTPEQPLVWSDIRQQLAERGLSNANVLVFYVDTLRFDVAHDPLIMPNLARFAAESLDFKRAYASGSDTLRSLPGITGGNYFVRHTHAADLCQLAQASNHESSLFISKSAREFLSRLRPSFSFQHEVLVPDYDEGREVWGYGADLPTSEDIVDRALEYLKQRGGEPFFMWLFHFDQHNWRELNDDYIDEVTEEHHVPPEGEFNSRYRAIATAIDAQLGRLLQGLDDLGQADNTVVMLLSDHGEGLGEGGFWVHSVFLWESLIHVPLLLRVPGVEPAVIDQVVSLIDVAPTLAPFLQSDPLTQAYHGEDLLRHVDQPDPKRRYPVLFAAALRDELVRIGTLDEHGHSKLVLRLEAALVELHDLRRYAPDADNIADERPEQSNQMLRVLAQSPFFPRELDDFRMLNPKGQLIFDSPQQNALPTSTGHRH